MAWWLQQQKCNLPIISDIQAWELSSLNLNSVLFLFFILKIHKSFIYFQPVLEWFCLILHTFQVLHYFQFCFVFVFFVVKVQSHAWIWGTEFLFLVLSHTVGNQATITVTGDGMKPQSTVGIKIPIKAKLIGQDDDEEDKARNGLYEYQVNMTVCHSSMFTPRFIIHDTNSYLLFVHVIFIW